MKELQSQNTINHVKIDITKAVPIEEPLLNSYGLDLTHKDLLKYSDEHITIEVVGGVQDRVITQLKVNLKIYKNGNTSPTEIYRSQQTDLFNEHLLERLIVSVSERIKVERTKVKQAIYSLTDRLERYRIDKQTQPKEATEKRISVQAQQEVKNYLKSKNLLERLQKTFETAGVPNGELGLKLLLLSLSRITQNPIHTILQGDLFDCHEVIKSFKPCMPEEQLREATSVSSTALSYLPHHDYWQHKTLVLDRLDASLKKGSLMEEYINSGQLKRIVTEDNHKIGVRKSTEQNNSEVFGILSYTNKDFMPVFNASNVVCLPLPDKQGLQAKLYELEIKQHAGLLDDKKRQEGIQMLVNIQRSIQPLNVINPYFDQIDFQPFFKTNIKQIRLFLWLTKLITLLHQNELGRTKENGLVTIEVKPQYMIEVLELFKELWLTKDEALYFSVTGTFNRLKMVLKKEFPKEHKQKTFQVKDYWQKVGSSPATFSRHIKLLDEYSKIKRVGGDNRTGYLYTVREWEESTTNVEQFSKLIEQLKSL